MWKWAYLAQESGGGWMGRLLSHVFHLLLGVDAHRHGLVRDNAGF